MDLKSHSPCPGIFSFSKGQAYQKTQSHGNTNEIPAFGQQGAKEKGWDSPHCQTPFQHLPSATLPRGGLLWARELKGSTPLKTGQQEISRCHVPHNWPHAAREGYPTGFISHICPISCCLPEVLPSRFPSKVRAE